AINELVAEAGKPRWDWEPEPVDEALKSAVATLVRDGLGEAYRTTDKMARQARVSELRAEAVERLAGGEAPQYEADDVAGMFAAVEKELVRERVLDGEPRIDGRDLRTVRPIDIQAPFLPKTHGSTLFTRGETQAIVVATLGTMRDAAFIDALEGSYKDNFLLHYNFPPYCVGEAGFMAGPKRREIGHGRLARRAVEAVLPSVDEFPYTLRVVSEITESNGSSSMATVCGTSLALMDAGVPVKAPVAGVAMGLVKDGNRYAVLTDILGDEDHLGDMDFKVAGTAKGVTALQMDIKIAGITEEIMEVALSQALEGRRHILGEMAKVIEQPRESVSENAPSMTVIHVPQDKIRDVIGKGGATIRAIVEETGADVDIEDDGSVRIYADDAAALEAAVARVEAITAEAEIGTIYQGTVAKVVDFGAFVNILPGKDGLLHVSQIADERVENVSDYLQEGQTVEVVVLDVDQRGRIKLSMKEVANYAETA
ncbi:MAG: polyribonucleotide nucleotidyltransferase, partial [Pseudomonadota bacterium]